MTRKLESRARLADRVMGELGLARPTTVDRILQSFTDSFFHAKDEDEYETEDCVRIAHIAAKLRASAPAGFQYAAQDGMLLDVNDDLVLADIDGKLDMFVDPAWYECNVLRGRVLQPHGHLLSRRMEELGPQPRKWAAYIRSIDSKVRKDLRPR